MGNTNHLSNIGNYLVFDEENADRKDGRKKVQIVIMPCSRKLIGRPGEEWKNTIHLYGYYNDGDSASNFNLLSENEVEYLQTKKPVPDAMYVLDRAGKNEIEEEKLDIHF